MLAKPISRKERKNMTPDRIMEFFLPIKSKVMDERQLPRTAPMGGRETAMVFLV